ncbi:MAG: hypothetical protein KDI07_20055 [Anaerolineae bacterium]|nr:hypothetical protein [Anaerolineae bacterium]MCB9129380.1 hypothetical protein [Anaerolineales bacterium]MCB0229956.1 hypothetical protein [Anaerolineae bacterium]MCB0234851.1 hypothetical protein [Anaerolineae bacterium]MCB0239658.1 hypothetical protein [Anaerolineae bacterium]
MRTYLLLVSLLAIMLAGCASQPLLQPATDADTIRVSIIEMTLRGSGDENAMHSEETQVYVAHVPLHELNAWLRDSEARTAAQIEGRPVDEIVAEWQQAGIQSGPELAGDPMVWFVDIRGISHQPPRMFGANPRDWDQDATDEAQEPFYYDNFHMIFNEQGAGTASGAFTDASTAPPLGDQVPLDQMYDDPYVFEISIKATPATTAPVALPTSTPFVP